MGDRCHATDAAGTSRVSSPRMLRFRRSVTGYEHHARDFLAFVKLACIAILLRQPTLRGKSRLGDSFPFNRLSDAF
jgi:hypothetical protein